MRHLSHRPAHRTPAGLIAPVLATLITAAVLSACGGMEEPPQGPPVGLELEKIGGYAHAGGASSAEITAFDPISQREDFAGYRVYVSQLGFDVDDAQRNAEKNGTSARTSERVSSPISSAVVSA